MLLVSVLLALFQSVWGYTDFTRWTILHEAGVCLGLVTVCSVVLKCKSPFVTKLILFTFGADQNGFFQETEVNILKLPVEILYLYKKTRKFECQMFKFSVATYLICHSSCLRFPEHLVHLANISEAKHFIHATLHSRMLSQREKLLWVFFFFFAWAFLFLN